MEALRLKIRYRFAALALVLMLIPFAKSTGYCLA